MLGEFRALQESFGVTVQPLTGRECRAAEPMLDPSVRGGLLAPDDASVDPRLLTSALLMAATGAGVRLIRSAAVEVTVTGGRADGAVLADGTGLRADWVVLAAGWRSGSLAGLPPERGPAGPAGQGPDPAAAAGPRRARAGWTRAWRISTGRAARAADPDGARGRAGLVGVPGAEGKR